MAINQPQTTDKLNNPSHSKMHRVIAIDGSAPDLSLCVDVDGGLCFGNPATNGSWKFVISGNNLSIQRRESGVWVEKGGYIP